MWNLGVLKLIVVIFDLKLDGPNLNNLEFEGLCRSEGFRMAPMEEHASILSARLNGRLSPCPWWVRSDDTPSRAWEHSFVNVS